MTALVNPAELAELVHLGLDTCAKREPIPMMVWGAPGVGKSSVIAAVCRERGVGFLDIRLSQREPIDMRGLPVPDGDCVRWLPSGEWPRDPDSQGVVLFDEITAADRSVQVAAYEFILDRRLGDLYALPPGWLVMAAGNRAADRAISGTFSSALANRFAHVELEPHIDDWCVWAHRAELDPAVIAFLRFRPDLLLCMDGDLERGWPSPRSWERVGRLLADAPSMVARRALVAGLVGEGPAAELAAFMTMADSLPDVDQLLAASGAVSFPRQRDRQYAIAQALVHRLRTYMHPEDIVGRLLEIACAFTADIAALFMTDLLAVLSSEGVAALAAHPRWQQWVDGHGKELYAADAGAA